MGGVSAAGGRGSSPAPARLLVHELAAAAGLDPEANRCEQADGRGRVQASASSHHQDSIAVTLSRRYWE